MNIYTCTSFEGHWPVGSAAVVVAESADGAAELLNAELRSRGLKDNLNTGDFELVDTATPKAIVLCDGNY